MKCQKVEGEYHWVLVIDGLRRRWRVRLHSTSILERQPFQGIEHHTISDRVKEIPAGNIWFYLIGGEVTNFEKDGIAKIAPLIVINDNEAIIQRLIKLNPDPEAAYRFYSKIQLRYVDVWAGEPVEFARALLSNIARYIRDIPLPYKEKVEHIKSLPKIGQIVRAFIPHKNLARAALRQIMPQSDRVYMNYWITYMLPRQKIYNK